MHVELLGREPSVSSDELAQPGPTCGPQLVDRRGATSLSGLQEHLSSLDVVAATDTGGLHLAAALGVPVIGLYFGGAECSYTGPYAPRSMVIQNPLWDAESVSTVAHLISGMARHGEPADCKRDVMLPHLDRLGVFYAAGGAGDDELCTLHAEPETDQQRHGNGSSGQRHGHARHRNLRRTGVGERYRAMRDRPRDLRAGHGVRAVRVPCALRLLLVWAADHR